MIARLPEERQAEPYEHCWRKDWQDKEAHLARTLSGRPDLIQIDAGPWKTHNERRPGTLRKNEYIVIDAAGNDVKPYSGISNTVCESVREALIVDGPGAGTIQSVCADARCPVHGNPDAPTPLTSEDREAQESEWQRQEQREHEHAERVRAKRLELLNSITRDFTTPLLGEIASAFLHDSRRCLNQNLSSAHRSARAPPAALVVAETPRRSSPRPASRTPAARAQRCLCPRERCSP